MEDMELVIKIDKDDYHRIISGFADEDDAGLFKDLFRKGVALPKDHGRLIDADKLKTHFIGTEQGTDLEVYLEPTIIDAPTIIEAAEATS